MKLLIKEIKFKLIYYLMKQEKEYKMKNLRHPKFFLIQSSLIEKEYNEILIMMITYKL